MKREWPKKYPAGLYLKRWHVGTTLQTIRNRIDRNDLPGGKEHGSGAYFVWVNEDLTPAYGYTAPASNTPQSAGASIAAAILDRKAS